MRFFFVNLQFCVQAEFSVKSSGGRNKHKKKDSQVKLKIKRMNSKSATDLVREAKLQTENLTPQQVESELKSENVVLIDIRESEELIQNGKIEKAVHAPRGMIEFYADPSLPYHKQEFDKNKRIILHCASGGRSALAVSTLKQMGYTNVAHLDGGINAWKEAGLPVKK
ncbi:MAG TPA: rhodanese-like domain-containing protein [Bacteroidales bacterium]|nr:rhodanese-like domain-containing protein [Bacteroidales bacterium]